MQGSNPINQDQLISCLSEIEIETKYSILYREHMITFEKICLTYAYLTSQTSHSIYH